MLFHQMLFLLWLITGQAFQLLPVISNKVIISSMLQAKQNEKTPEYIVEDSPEGESSPLSPPNSKTSEILLSAVNPMHEYIQPETSLTPSNHQSPNLQYAALPTGTMVQIQVGDMGLARKAWKKRRRSGSPLLVPCSVLNVDRASTVRWNLIYLLEKFGISPGGKSGIRLSLPELSKRYRSHLKTNLTMQATSLGYEDPKALLKELFNERVQQSYGVFLVENENGEIALRAPSSRMRAQKRANQSPIIQIADDHQEDTLKHTGFVRIRRLENTEDSDNNNIYQLQPLSAALRVNQKEDIDVGSIQTGSMHTAVVFDYDSAGDAGAPLITLSLNSAPRERVRFGAETQPKDALLHDANFMLKDLKIGDGPIHGKVVRFVKGGALIDCGIGRKIGSRPESDTVRVLGLLKFSEAIAENTKNASLSKKKKKDENEDWGDVLSFEELTADADEEEDDEEEEYDDDDDDDDDEEGYDDMDDEEELELASNTDLSSLFNFDDEDDEDATVEDITHMFTTDVDGSLTYANPETGEVQHISLECLDDDDDDDEEEDEELEEDSEEEGPVVFKRPTSTSVPSLSTRSNSPTYRSKRLYLGDEVDVFVKSVAKQSNQIFFTMKKSTRGRTAKDIKQESEKEKKLGRLLNQVGGMSRIRALKGREMDGVVKALSHTGDWLYVEPQGESLPVGIAYAGGQSLDGLNKGDTVRIKLDGIDEVRGQLAMKVLRKVLP